MPPRQTAATQADSSPELAHDELRRVFSNTPMPRDGLPRPETEPEPQPEVVEESTPPVVVTPLLVAAVSNDSWKAWAGRREGGDGFQVTDLFVGTAHAWSNYRRSRKGDSRSAGKECPVCFADDPPPDSAGKRWMRLYCGCTVCSGCVRNWNLAEIAGNTGTKKLSCAHSRAYTPPPLSLPHTNLISLCLLQAPCVWLRCAHTMLPRR